MKMLKSKLKNFKQTFVVFLCFMMCLSLFTPVSTFAKCSHKNTTWKTIQKATCKKEGKKIKVCNCGKSLKTKKIKKTDHLYYLTNYKPTCTTPQFVYHKCKYCGKSYTERVGKPLGHKWSKWKIDTKTLFNKNTKAVRICNRCKKVERKNAKDIKK